jgi:hypothetical protein
VEGFLSPSPNAGLISADYEIDGKSPIFRLFLAIL